MIYPIIATPAPSAIPPAKDPPSNPFLVFGVGVGANVVWILFGLTVVFFVWVTGLDVV